MYEVIISITFLFLYCCTVLCCQFFHIFICRASLTSIYFALFYSLLRYTSLYYVIHCSIFILLCSSCVTSLLLIFFTLFPFTFLVLSSPHPISLQFILSCSNFCSARLYISLFCIASFLLIFLYFCFVLYLVYALLFSFFLFCFLALVYFAPSWNVTFLYSSLHLLRCALHHFTSPCSALFRLA